MKEKITVLSVCILFTGMYMISRNSSLDTTILSTTDPNIIPNIIEENTDSYFDSNYPEIEMLERSESITEASKMNSCNLDNVETNNLAFKEAFKYYRKCQGPNGKFVWKDIEYTTLFSEEVIIEIADSMNIKNKTESIEISHTR